MLAEHAITRAARMPKATIQLGVSGDAKQGSVQVDVSISNISTLGVAEDLELWIAVTEVGLETDVQRGENATRHLRHAAVVRSLNHVETLTPPAHDQYTTSTMVAIEREWRPSHLRIVVFLQETHNRYIHGAGQAELH